MVELIWNDGVRTRIFFSLYLKYRKDFKPYVKTVIFKENKNDIKEVY